MPSLKDLRNRISSVKSTKKITSAMKMVAAAKLRKAQENAFVARPYSDNMSKIVHSLTTNPNMVFQKPSLISGKEKNETILLLVCSADRGLCGGFNGSVIRHTKKKINKLRDNGKNVKLVFLGKKAYQALKRSYENITLKIFSDFASPGIDFGIASEIRNYLVENFFSHEFDSCELIFTKFKSAISQEVTEKKLLPLLSSQNDNKNKSETEHNVFYEFEPSEEEILDQIVPKNIAVQIFTALLESAASEQGARMTAMDNATRNANDMIDNLTLFYNRSRQAVITKELIEIISGAEAI